MGFGVGSRGPRLPSHTQTPRFKRAQTSMLQPPQARTSQTARPLVASHIRQSFLLFKKNYPKPILSFFLKEQEVSTFDFQEQLSLSFIPADF